MKQFDPTRLNDTFRQLETQLEHTIVAAERPVSDTSSEIRRLFTGNVPMQTDFHQLMISGRELQTHGFQALIGSIVLVPNVRLQALSPAIITRKYAVSKLTMLDQPYDQKVGFTAGMQFALSVRSQTETTEFGSHGSARAFEAGHFGTLLIGARSSVVAQNIIQRGDTASDGIIRAGVPDTMAQTDLLDLQYRTKIIDPNDERKLALFWHPGLMTEQGSARGDYPDAVKLMLGAGAIKLGQTGIEAAKRLVDHAIKGME